MRTLRANFSFSAVYLRQILPSQKICPVKCQTSFLNFWWRIHASV